MDATKPFVRRDEHPSCTSTKPEHFSALNEAESPSILEQPPRERKGRSVSLEDLPHRQKLHSFSPEASEFTSSEPEPEPEPEPKPKPESESETVAEMTEPRARAARHKGQLNFESELTSLLYAFGDVLTPLPETVRVLDEIVTDFIIEMCHSAAKAAHYSGRQKVKVEDFMFAMRHDPLMIGRVKELLGMERELKEARKHFDTGEGKVGLERGGRKRKVREGEDPPDGV